MYEQKGKIMRIARFCTSSGSLERYAGRLSRKTGHVYSVTGRMQVQKNWTSPRVPRPERLSWDKLYRHFWAFLIMESMWEFHFKSLETLRPSILAVATNSIGLSLTTTGSKDVVFLVLKFMRSSLHFVSFTWNLAAEVRLTRVSTAAWICLSWFLLYIVSEMVVSAMHFQRSVYSFITLYLDWITTWFWIQLI